jgi:hypothetical protein
VTPAVGRRHPGFGGVTRSSGTAAARAMGV